MGVAERMDSERMDADRFLRALGGRFTFQTFDDAKDHRRGLTRILHGTLAEHGGTLAGMNAKGAGIFVMVNAGDGKGRKTTNVQQVRAYFVDLDGAPLDPVLKAPLRSHIIIESSPGRWHAYWLVEDAPLESFKCVQQALIGRFDSDPAVCDLPRVMRLPGFMHRKGAPFKTRIVELRTTPRYTHAEFLQAFGIDGSDRSMPSGGATVTKLPTARKRRSLPRVIPAGERNNVLLSLAAGLVRKGHAAAAVNDRLQKINADRCQPPLGADEVDQIAERAFGYGSDGFTMLPHKLLDSEIWKGLPPRAHDIVLMAFRRYDGTNNNEIALAWEDFCGLPGFGNKQTFYKHRALVVKAGILTAARTARNTQRGKAADLFGIAECWLPETSARYKKETWRQVQKRNPYIDKQLLAVEGAGEHSARISQRGVTR